MNSHLRVGITLSSIECLLAASPAMSRLRQSEKNPPIRNLNRGGLTMPSLEGNLSD
jgi:hypothetical protein